MSNEPVVIMSNEPVVSDEAIKEAIAYLRRHFNMDDSIGAILAIFPVGGQDAYPTSIGINVPAEAAPEVMRWFANNATPGNITRLEDTDA